MDSLREVIERRVNAFGVSEAVVRVEEAGIISGNQEHHLIVELPGVTDTQKAIAIIGATPSLEFKLEPKTGAASTTDDLIPTGITGRLVQHAQLDFNSGQSTGGVPNQAVVLLQFNSEGKELFAKATRENIGKIMAIVLDGEVISAPRINEEIPDGNAVISGNFTPEEAKTLVRNLNYGALPVPIELSSTQVVGATLGTEAKDRGVKAGLIGFLAIGLFLLLAYRFPGFVSLVTLFLYVLITLALFKLIPVTLTAAGIAGFIISIGMAIDANILIFERMKDEFRNGHSISSAVSEGFSRAWLPVRDAHLSGIIAAIILYWLGTTAVKGFALTLGIGNIISLFTAVTATRTFLHAISENLSETPFTRFIFGKKNPTSNV